MCPYSFKKLYLDKSEKLNNAFAEFGSLCHGILEDYEKGNLMEYELEDAYNERYDSYVVDKFPPSRGRPMDETYYEKGLEYFSRFNGFPENWEIIGAEIDSQFKIDDISMVGFIDLLVRDKIDGKLIVVDHKSKSGFKNDKEKAEYAIQLYLYSKWVIDNYGEAPKQLVFNMFTKNDTVTIEFSQNEYDAALDWVRNIVKSIYNDLDFWDNIYLSFEDSGKDITQFSNSDFFCNYLCSCRTDCERSIEGVQE